MRIGTFSLSVAVVVLLAAGGATPARADVAPADICTSPGQPCQNAGAITGPGHPGTCVATTCTKSVRQPDGGFTSMTYDCNRCEAPDGGTAEADGAAGAGGGTAGAAGGTAGATGAAGATATGGTIGTGGVPGTGGSPATGATGGHGAKPPTSSSGCALAGSPSGRGVGVVALALALAATFIRRRRRTRA